jgi:type IV pilus assembly protein PilA
MLNMLRQRRDEDEGFTLIELMVVVLIIAILIAIAIPTFLGAQDRARDRGTQSDLRNAITAAKTLATDNAGMFLGPDGTTEIDAAILSDAEPSLAAQFQDSALTGVDQIYVNTDAGGVAITLSKKSASGTEFGISSTSDGQVTYCKSETAGACDTAAENTLTKW